MATSQGEGGRSGGHRTRHLPTESLYWLLILVAAVAVSGFMVAVGSAWFPPPNRFVPGAVWIVLTVVLLTAYAAAFRSGSGTGERRFVAAIRDEFQKNTVRYWVLLVFVCLATAGVYAAALAGRGKGDAMWDQLWDPLITVVTLLTALGLFVANLVQAWEARLPRRLDAHYRLITDRGSVPILSLHRAELSGESDIRAYGQSILQGLKSEWALDAGRGAMRPYFNIDVVGATRDDTAQGDSRWFYLYRVTLFIQPGADGEFTSWPGMTGREQHSDRLPAGWDIVPMPPLRTEATGEGPLARPEPPPGNRDPGTGQHRGADRPDGEADGSGEARLTQPGYVVWTRLQADYPAHDSYYVTASCAEGGLDPQRPAGSGEPLLSEPEDDWFEKVAEHVRQAVAARNGDQPLAEPCGCEQVLDYSNLQHPSASPGQG